MTPTELRIARKRLGLTQHGLAGALRMGKNGWQSVSRWEQDGNTIPGPVQVAVESLLQPIEALRFVEEQLGLISATSWAGPAKRNGDRARAALERLQPLLASAISAETTSGSVSDG